MQNLYGFVQNLLGRDMDEQTVGKPGGVKGDKAVFVVIGGLVNGFFQ